MMFGKCKHGDADVRKDEILCQKVQQLEKSFRSSPRIRRQIIVRIMSLTDTAKQHRYHAYRKNNKRKKKPALLEIHNTCSVPSFRLAENLVEVFNG